MSLFQIPFPYSKSHLLNHLRFHLLHLVLFLIFVKVGSVVTDVNQSVPSAVIPSNPLRFHLLHLVLLLIFVKVGSVVTDVNQTVPSAVINNVVVEVLEGALL